MKAYAIKTPKQLGAVLKGYRKSHTLTQTEVGSKVGLPQKEISKLELDPSRASLSRVFKLLAALNLDISVQERATPASSGEW